MLRFSLNFYILPLQDKHKEELEGLRSAGHDALAVVVEEYKVMEKLNDRKVVPVIYVEEYSNYQCFCVWWVITKPHKL